MVAELPREEESAARSLIEQASAALARRRRDIPVTFVAQLYGRSVPEDVVRYGADDIAALAERAYDFIVERAPGTPKIRCENVPLAVSGDRRATSVIEIVNDDMPFLVDSVMGEIADRRLEVGLVAHPLFGVKRNGSKLVSLETPDTAEGKRESFIHIHLAPIADDDAARAELVRALQTVLGEVRLAVRDWRAMLDRVNGIVANLKANPPPLR
ncbi:MAG TPA: NAD-glutamate dehydrogenase, partial [Pseudolabrys sp.]